MSIALKAYAKVNIHLDITGRFSDGYHSLFMVMQSVGLYDRIILEKAGKGITLLCSDKHIPLDESNTEYKAARLFFEKTGIQGGVIIETEKNIPQQAGLAGGSADAAAVLTGLNILYGAGLSEHQLREIGLQVGSDVPFCLKGGTCLVQSRGGIIAPVKPAENCFAVLVKPERGVSTAQAYADADETYLYHPDNSRMLEACETGSFEDICKYAGNVFEQVVEVPERVDIKKIMREHNCLMAQMTGSGPTVFGLFGSKDDAQAAAEKLKKICPGVFLTEPVDCGVSVE